MRLYLVRHGQAVSKEVYTDRPLSEDGKSDCLKTAEFLRGGKIKIEEIWHSDKRRAKETAEIFSDILKPAKGVIERKDIGPDDPVDPVFKEIVALNKDIMLVGHIPFIQKLTSLALLNSGSFEVVQFNMGGVVCLDKKDDGKWLLLFELIPEIVR